MRRACGRPSVAHSLPRSPAWTAATGPGIARGGRCSEPQPASAAVAEPARDVRAAAPADRELGAVAQLDRPQPEPALELPHVVEVDDRRAVDPGEPPRVEPVLERADRL